MKKFGNDSRYNVSYHELVPELDLIKLDKPILREICHAIETKIYIAPDIFGKPLRGTLHGFWSLRVGYYRIAYQIVGRRVIIGCIKHRNEIYEDLQKRFGL